MVSVDELQKAVDDPSRDKVNPQEPPSVSIATSTQILMLPPPSPIVAIVDTSGVGDTIQKLSVEEGKDTTIGPIGQIDIAQSVGTPPLIVIDQGKSDEEKEDK